MISKMSVAKAAVATGLLSVVTSQNADNSAVVMNFMKGSSNSHTFVAANGCGNWMSNNAPTAGSDPNNVKNENTTQKWYHGIASCGGMASANPLNTGTLPPTEFCFLIPVPCFDGIFCCNSIICTGATWVIIVLTGVCCCCCLHPPSMSDGDGNATEAAHGHADPHGHGHDDAHKKHNSNTMMFVVIGALMLMGFGYFFLLKDDDDEDDEEMCY